MAIQFMIRWMVMATVDEIVRNLRGFKLLPIEFEHSHDCSSTVEVKSTLFECQVQG